MFELSPSGLFDGMSHHSRFALLPRTAWYPLDVLWCELARAYVRYFVPRVVARHAVDSCPMIASWPRVGDGFECLVAQHGQSRIQVSVVSPWMPGMD